MGTTALPSDARCALHWEPRMTITTPIQLSIAGYLLRTVRYRLPTAYIRESHTIIDDSNEPAVSTATSSMFVTIPTTHPSAPSMDDAAWLADNALDTWLDNQSFDDLHVEGSITATEFSVSGGYVRFTYDITQTSTLRTS